MECHIVSIRSTERRFFQNVCVSVGMVVSECTLLRRQKIVIRTNTSRTIRNNEGSGVPHSSLSFPLDPGYIVHGDIAN